MDRSRGPPVYPVARALNFAAIVTLLGVVALRVLVIPAVVRGDASRQSTAFAPVAARAGAKLGLLAGLAALLASLGRLRGEFSVVGLDASVWSLLQTTWGHVWIAQVILAVVACAAFALAAVMDGPILRAGAWILAATAAVLMAATPALSGHAAGASRYRTFSLALDTAHVLAAGGWLGGLLAIALAGVPAAMIVSSDSELGGGLPLIARIVNAFSPTALVFAACVVVTGSIAAWLRIGSVTLLLASAYGEALLIKLALVAIVFAGGAYSWLRMRRALTRYESETAAVITFRRTAWAELVTGMLVIIATAVLVALPPPTG
ncbi:MAG: CopD family protein [Gemmatimonadota bacterium]|nr:CopD family protein [Gemmatimonadota bacterium]